MQLESGVTAGLPFSRNYLRPEILLKDSPRLRVRVGQAFSEMAFHNWEQIENFIARDIGVIVDVANIVQFKYWFSSCDLVDFLDSITSIWKYFEGKAAVNVGKNLFPGKEAANVWRNFVSHAFSNESMGYQLDEKCGVHFFIDSEFESGRVSTVAGLGSSRYRNVSHSLEKAYRFLDGANVDTKSAARSAFEALEILSKLIVPEAQNLNGRMIELRLEPLVLQGCKDEAHRNMASAILKSLKEFVNGVHYYRHGQGEEAVVEPPLDIAVYILSQVSNAIRLLIPVDQRLQSAS